MTQQELQKLLNQPYSTENWKKVVQEVFPNVQLLNPALTIPVDNLKVESFRQLGNVRLQDGKSLALFELKLKSNVNILRNRVELNNLVSQYIDQEQNHGVLSIFEQGGEDYRFTFSARATEFDETEADFVTKKTDTKRFTYVLGKNESCKTPAQRLHDLSTKKEKADINTIQDAFSVEKLSKEFFAEYKVHYERMVKYLTESPTYRLDIFKGDEKAIRDFVKLTLGRLVFIQFLQKKRWIGVPATEAGWDSGDPYFLKHSFQDFAAKDAFYSKFLEPLFFETLNKDGRPNQVFSITGTKVPYLNGGLFEKGKENSHLINFPAAFFEGLFEFFDRYNFTIDESDPKEQEVGIDPEMLGHIFENLLEDNKDKGAFYTPKEIVHYMCQESLLEYLKTFLEEKEKWPASDSDQHALEEALSNFIKKKEGAGIIDYDRELAIALRDVKICDPAIGSGAFPMGLLNEIFHAVFILFQASPDVVGEEWGMDEWKPNVVKKNIIQNSIYGVDIEKGAVDIARLRFWLSLIMDEPEPEALPNLDYKIVVGNSLVSKLDDTIIDIDWDIKENKAFQANIFGSGDLHANKGKLLRRISEEQKAFFNPKSDKKKLAADISKLKIELLINQLELMISTQGAETKPNGMGKKLAEQTTRHLQTLSWNDSIKQLKKLKDQPDYPLNFFDWKLDFPEVLNDLINTNPGFDIVIANPPYVEFKNLDKDFKKNLEPKYKSLKGKYDLYIAFLEKYFQLTAKNGCIISINPTRFMQRDYGKTIREIISEIFNVVSIIDFHDKQVFENAMAYTGIFTFKNKKINNGTLNYSRPKTNKTIKSINELHFNSSPEIFEYLKIENIRLKEEVWSFKRDEYEAIFYKMRKIGTPLEKVVDGIYQGIATGKDDVFLVDKNTIEAYRLEKEILKPFLKGKDIGPYKISFKNKYLIYPYDNKGSVLDEEIVLKKYPNIYTYLKSKKNELSGRGYFDKSNKLWYELWNQRNPKRFEQIKVVTLDNAKKNSFALDIEGNFGSTTVYNLIKDDTDLDFLIELVLILNSKLMNFYHKNNTIPQAGGFLRYQAIFIKDLPIKFGLGQYLIQQVKESYFNGIEKILLDKVELQLFKIYELNFDEVKIIDPEFHLSEEEYNAITVE